MYYLAEDLDMKNQGKTQGSNFSTNDWYSSCNYRCTRSNIYRKKYLETALQSSQLTEKIVSPVDGVVSKIVETGHIYEITSESGVIILIHMGLETVALNGKCFHIYAKDWR